MRTDLHVHTFYSDGYMSPEEVVNEAYNNGVRALAVTDHDTMRGVPEARRQCEKLGIKLIEGIEVSAYLQDIKLHTLGYNVDAHSAAYARFSAELYEGSIVRARDILNKLNSNGVALSFSEVEAEKRENTPVHAMHIAAAGAKKGYAANPFSFFLKYLAYGKCAYSRLCRPTPERTIEAIRESGGFASLAHPGRIDMPADELKKLVFHLKDCGLRGIEAVYSTHTVIETAYYKELASEVGLVITGGSDVHYKGGNKSIGTPVFYPDGELARLLTIEE